MTTINLRKYAFYVGILAVVLAFTLYLAYSAKASGYNVLYGNDLSVGDTGSNVVDLQALLSEQGYLDVPANVPLGYFGPLTKSALSRYQATLGVPTTGYYGPLTRASAIASFGARGWLSLLATAR